MQIATHRGEFPTGVVARVRRMSQFLPHWFNSMHHAAMVGNTSLAKKLVDKNPLLLLCVSSDNNLPIDLVLLAQVSYVLIKANHGIGITKYENVKHALAKTVENFDLHSRQPKESRNLDQSLEGLAKKLQLELRDTMDQESSQAASIKHEGHHLIEAAVSYGSKKVVNFWANKNSDNMFNLLYLQSD
ncbi:hypothetical protein Tco_0472998 [Tanacetum coccineum]